MPRLKKIAYVATGCTAVFGLAAQIILTVYLGVHRPKLPGGVNCYELKGFAGPVFVTQAESTIVALLSGILTPALFVALLLHISLKSRP
jgi:hypothetical protein